jgi:hypothetical protein
MWILAQWLFYKLYMIFSAMICLGMLGIEVFEWKYHFWQFWTVTARHGEQMAREARLKAEWGCPLASYSQWRAGARLRHTITRHGEQTVGQLIVCSLPGGSDVSRAVLSKQSFKTIIPQSWFQGIGCKKVFFKVKQVFSLCSKAWHMSEVMALWIG